LSAGCHQDRRGGLGAWGRLGRAEARKVHCQDTGKESQRRMKNDLFHDAAPLSSMSFILTHPIELFISGQIAELVHYIHFLLIKKGNSCVYYFEDPIWDIDKC